MTKFPEYHKFDGIGLCELIKKGDITAEEVLEEAINRAEKINPKINAIILPLYDFGKKYLKRASKDAPLYGVPFLLKDLLSHLRSTPLTSGSRLLKNFISSFDSEVVKRYKKSGLVIMGKTNTPEFGLMGTTEPDLFGPTQNPWNLDHIPGGSSGGSAAAVAARIVPIAGGGDGGGSLRIPASCCGIFGFKPSRGRVPVGPEFGEIWEGAVVEHVLTISVRDSAKVLDLISGPDKGAMYWLSKPKESFFNACTRDPKKLKIGFCTKSPVGDKVHSECINAVKNAASLLEDLGHIVEEVELPYNGELVADCYFNLYFGQVKALLMLIKEALVDVDKYKIELETWLLGTLGEKINAGEYAASLIKWNILARSMARYHEKYQILLTPTIATLPPKIGELRTKGLEKIFLEFLRKTNLKVLARVNITKKISIKRFAKMPFTQVANITGQPAMSIPIYWTKNNLPSGVQFIAPIGEDTVLFQLAGQIERARPWKEKIPPLVKKLYENL